MKALAAGKAINYSGASGPCDFDEVGDITGVLFLFKQVEDGAAQVFRRV